MNTRLSETVSWARNHPTATIGAIVALVISLFVLRSLTHTDAPRTEAAPQQKKVTVQTVAELSGGASSFMVVGTVTSENEAMVRAEKSGQIVRLNYTLGAPVRAGAIIAEFDNKSERAAVAQASATVDVARAAYNKVTGGSRSEQKDILKVSLENARASLLTSRSNAATTIVSAYATLDTAVRGTADTLFSNAETFPQFLVQSSNSQFKLNAQNERSALQPTLLSARTASPTIAAESDLMREIAAAENALTKARSFLDTVVAALSTAIPVAPYTESSIEAALTSITGARTSVSAALATLNATRDALDAKATAVAVAEKNLAQGIVGGQPEDVETARASLAQAQAGLAAASASLERGVIRAPVSGTINSLPVRRGDFVQAFSPVAVVANNGTLEVIAAVTDADMKELQVGDTVAIEGDIARGTITKIAPALDPVTKKIELRVAITKGAAQLTNGQSVTISVPRSSVAAPSRITVPIAALKVGSETMSVFTVENGALVAHPVEIGTLLGERVVIRSGLTPSMRIVIDVRGLREGEEVVTR